MADMDLGSLFVTLKATNESALKAIKEYEEAMKRASDHTKKANEGMTLSFQSVGTALKVLKTGAEVFFTPLRLLIEGFITLESIVQTIGITCVKTAGDFEFLYKKMELFIGSTAKVNKAWGVGIKLAGYFSVDDIMEATIKLERVGITGEESMRIIRDAAIMLGESVDAVATSIVRMSAGTLRGLRLMGVNFAIEGSTFYFRYLKQGGEYVNKVVVGVKAAQQATLQAMQDMFGGAYEKLKNTLPVLWKTLLLSLMELREEAGRGFLVPIKLMIKDATGIIQSLYPSAEKWGESVGFQLMKARAYILSAFETALKIANLIQQVLKIDGGFGVVLLETFKLGAKLIMNGLLAAVEASIPIWVAISKILGQGVLEALYSSGLPMMKWFGEKARANNIEAALAGVSVENLRGAAQNQGIDLTSIEANAQRKIYDIELGEIKLFSEGVLRKAIAKQFADAWKDLPYDEVNKKLEEMTIFINDKLEKEGAKYRIDTISTNAGMSIQRALEQAKGNVEEAAEKLITSAGTDLQDFVDNLSGILNTPSLDVGAESAESLKKYLAEAVVKWKEFKDVSKESEEALVNVNNKIKQVSEGIELGRRQMNESLKDLKMEYNLLGLTNAAREKAIALDKQRVIANKTFGGILDENNQYIGDRVTFALAEATARVDKTVEALNVAKVEAANAKAVASATHAIAAITSVANASFTSIAVDNMAAVDNIAAAAEARVKALSTAAAIAAADVDAAAAAEEGIKKLKAFEAEYDKFQTRQKSFSVAFMGQIKQWGEDATNVWKNMGTIATRAMDGIGDSIHEMVMTGKADFRALASSIINDITKMTIKAMIWQTVMGISKTFNFSGLFYNNPATADTGDTVLNPAANASVHHRGGIVGQINEQRLVASSIFSNAHRYHQGLGSDELPAILQRGEIVIPKGGGLLINQQPPNIIINNNTGQGMKQGNAPKFDGKKWVIDIVTDNINNYGSLRHTIQGVR